MMKTRGAMTKWMVVGSLALALAHTAHASDIKVTMTVDNSYALFYGTATAATHFVGSDFS